MSMCRVLVCFWKRVFPMTSAFSWQKSVSLCPASFCTPRSNLPVTPSVSWFPTFAFQSPIMKKTSFWVLVLEGLVGLHRTIQLQLHKHYWSRHRPGLLWYWMVCLENEQRSFCLPQDRWSWWRVLIKCGPLDKGMANHFSILALRTPWTVWKGKNIGHWKMNSPGQ